MIVIASLKDKEKNLKKKKTATKKETEKVSSISFEEFNEKNIERDGKVSSISLRLKDIEPFDKNVRLKYTAEDMATLKQSIEDRDDIGNIDVYHIVKGERFIISDGHRNYKAYLDLYGKDHKIEVIVRKEVPTMTPEVELQLMQIGFITSNTKQNLGFYEEAYSLKKYLDQLDVMYPDKTPHKVSQKNIYEALGLKKSKAMKYNGLLQKFTLKELSNFEDEEVSYKLLLELAKIKNQDEFAEVVNVIKDGKIENPTDLNSYNEIKDEIISDEDEKEDGKMNDDDVKEKIVTEMEKVKLRAEYKSVKSIKTASKKFCKEILKLDLKNLTEEEEGILWESIENVKRIIKDKQL